jgi:hypothetical protein
MRKWMMMLGTVLFTVTAAGLTQAHYRFDDTIKDVMKGAMKGGLCKTVAEGKASEAQKKELLELFEALHKAKPPKGEDKSWDEKTAALVDAVKAAIDGKQGASEQLKKAANCKACHDTHKGS